MPVRDLHKVANCSRLTVVAEINDHVVVLRNARGHPHEVSIVPISALPRADFKEFTLDGRYTAWSIFFVGERQLCMLVQDVPYGRSPHIVCIQSKDDIFLEKVIDRLYIPQLKGFHFLQSSMKTLDIPERTVVLTLWMQKRFPGEGEAGEFFKTTVRVTETSMTPGELVRCSALPSPSDELTNVGRPGAFGFPAGRGSKLYYDTGVAQMPWMTHTEPIYGTGDLRWITCRTEDEKILIFDSAERSALHTAALKAESDTEFWTPSVKVSANGTGILAGGRCLYKFTATAFVHPLERLAAISTWNQLPIEKWREIDSTGICGFETLIKSCYSL